MKIVSSIAFAAFMIAVSAATAQPTGYPVQSEETNIVSDRVSGSSQAKYKNKKERAISMTNIVSVGGYNQMKRTVKSGLAGDTTLEVDAHFVSAAYVEFADQGLAVPNMDRNYLKRVAVSKDTAIRVHGAPGETAIVSCEIQKMDKGGVQTYIPVNTRKCNQEERIELTMGNSIKNKVMLDVDDTQHNKYVSLDVTYL